jgi:hypothetical protein
MLIAKKRNILGFSDTVNTGLAGGDETPDDLPLYHYDSTI